VALKLYGGTDSNNGIEFMVRADTLDGAQETADFLLSQIGAAEFLVASDFTPPIRLNTSLKNDNFPALSAVNGGFDVSPQIVLSVYEALLMDGRDNTYAASSENIAASPINDFQVIAWIEFQNYSGAGEQVIAEHWVNDSNIAVWRLAMNDTSLEFTISSNGIFFDSISADLDITHDTGIWVRAIYETEPVFDTRALTLKTSLQPRLIEPSDITWIPQNSAITTIESLDSVQPALRTIGADLNINPDGTINVMNGSIGRVLLIDGISDDDIRTNVLWDMFPDQDARGTLKQDLGLSIIGAPTFGVAVTPASSQTVGSNGITFLAWIQFDDYTVGGSIFNQGDVTPGNFSYEFSVSNNQIVLLISEDGTAVVGGVSDIIPFVDGEGMWINARYIGAIDNITFETSNDPNDTLYTSIIWDVISSSTAVLSADIFESSANLTVGGREADEDFSPSGIIFRALLLNGSTVGSPVGVDMYPNRDAVKDATSWTSGSGFEEIWDLVGNVFIVPFSSLGESFSWISHTGETWNAFGRASVGIPVVGGGILAFDFVNGTDGNYINTVDLIGDAIANTISLAVWVEITGFASNEDPVFINKGFKEGESAGPQVEFAWSIGYTSSGGFFADFGDPISPQHQQTFFSGLDLGVGDALWVAVTYRPAVKIVTFYTSSDAIDEDATSIEWTQIDQQFSSLVGSTLNINGFNIDVGAQSGHDIPSALIARALVFEGELDGTLKKDMACNRDYEDGSRFTSATTGEIWEISGTVPLEYV